MIVCIAEKPSVARDIARILGANSSHDGYMEGNGYQVTWTFGHLCTLKEPGDYTQAWKPWALTQLPMVPQRFGIKLIEDNGIKKQFATIEKLMQAADGIVNCGDAGQEGELIQRWVMQKAQATQWRRRPSPHADLQAKADLSMAALHAIELSREMRQLYERKLGNKPKDKDMQKKALNAVKFKLIREMFSVAKQARNFELRGLDKAQAEAHSTEE